MVEKQTCHRDAIHIINNFVYREFLPLDDNGRCLLEIERSLIGEDCLGGDCRRFGEVRDDYKDAS